MIVRKLKWPYTWLWEIIVKKIYMKTCDCLKKDITKILIMRLFTCDGLMTKVPIIFTIILTYSSVCTHINSKCIKLSLYLLTAALSVAQQSRWTEEIAYETQGVTVQQYVTERWKNSSWKQDEGALFQMSRCIFMAAAECFFLYKHRASTPPNNSGQ